MENRRHFVSFDPRHFEKREEELDIKTTFSEIYQRNHWGGDDSVSGEGSGEEQTKKLKTELPGLLRELEIDKLLDLPCGDLGWIKDLDLPIKNYIGADIVEELIQHNRNVFDRDKGKSFEVLDLTNDNLPAADLLLCRDCLVHFSFKDISKSLRNIRESSITWLLTTTFTECTHNENIPTGDWRILNLQQPPFSFPSPRYIINEGCTEGNGNYRDKSLALWQVDDLPEI